MSKSERKPLPFPGNKITTNHQSPDILPILDKILENQTKLDQIFKYQNVLYKNQETIIRITEQIYGYLFGEKIRKENTERQNWEAEQRDEEAQKPRRETKPGDHWDRHGGKHQKFKKHSDKLRVKKNEEITRNPKPIKSKAKKKNSDKVQSTKKV